VDNIKGLLIILRSIRNDLSCLSLSIIQGVLKGDIC
jgi:hypothetical protein